MKPKAIQSSSKIMQNIAFSGELIKLYRFVEFVQFSISLSTFNGTVSPDIQGSEAIGMYTLEFKDEKGFTILKHPISVCTKGNCYASVDVLLNCRVSSIWLTCDGWNDTSGGNYGVSFAVSAY